MPEYLAPAVYVEEVDTGSKPIEGVSTSTAGMVGVTERGPVNVPTLITSYAEYQRAFGQSLTAGFYGDHCYLPHAVEGFFTNGGKRVYVTRVTAGAATTAARNLLAVDTTAPVATQLAAGAAAGDSSVVVMSGTGLIAGASVQIGTGAGAEFGTIQAPTAVDTIALEQPLGRGHAANANVEEIAAPGALGGAGAYNSTLSAACPAGATMITCAAAAPAGPIWLLVGTGTRSEYVQTVAGPGSISIGLATPLQLAHASGDGVVRQTIPGAGTMHPLNVPAGPGSTMAILQPGPFATAVARLYGATAADTEIRRVGTPRDGRGDGACVRHLSQWVPRRGHHPRSVHRWDGADRRRPDRGNGCPGRPTAPHSRSVTSSRLAQRQTSSGSRSLRFRHGSKVWIRERSSFARVFGSRIPSDRHSRDDPGAPTAINYLASLAAETSDTTLVMTRNGSAVSDILRVTPPGDGPFFHVVASLPVTVTPQRLPLSVGTTLGSGHPAGSAVVGRAPMALVRALDTGGWGNRVRVAMEEHPDPLLRTTVRQP